MPLKLTLRLNLVWACLMLLAISALLIFGFSVPRLVAFVASLGYVGVSYAALRRSVWALVTSIVVATVLLAYQLPMVLTNLGMFLGDHPLYLDSPGTILVVAVNALLLVIPALVLLLLYLIQWRKVVAFQGRRQSGA